MDTITSHPWRASSNAFQTVGAAGFEAFGGVSSAPGQWSSQEGSEVLSKKNTPHHVRISTKQTHEKTTELMPRWTITQTNYPLLSQVLKSYTIHGDDPIHNTWRCISKKNPKPNGTHIQHQIRWKQHLLQWHLHPVILILQHLAQRFHRRDLKSLHLCTNAGVNTCSR